MINSLLDSPHLDESGGYCIIKIGLLLAKIYQFEVFIAIALKLGDILCDRYIIS